MAQVFTADKAGTCDICKQEVQGTRIVRSRKEGHKGQYVHADCEWPKQARSEQQGLAQTAQKSSQPPSPKQDATTGQPRKTPPSLPPLPQPLNDADMKDLLAVARAITAEFLGVKPDEVLPENGLFLLVCNAKLQQQAQQFSLAQCARIEAQDERKMKAYGKGV